MARVRVAKEFRTDVGPRAFSRKLLLEQKAKREANEKASRVMRDANERLVEYRLKGATIDRAQELLKKKHRSLYIAYLDAIEHISRG